MPFLFYIIYICFHLMNCPKFVAWVYGVAAGAFTMLKILSYTLCHAGDFLCALSINMCIQ